MPGEDRDRKRHQNDGGDLRRIEFFFQKHCAEEDAEQRIDEITKGGIKRAAGADRPDIDAPVNADKGGRQARHGKHFRVLQRRPDFRCPPECNQHRRRDRYRPNDAVNNDLDRRNMRDRFHVEGRNPHSRYAESAKANRARCRRPLGPGAFCRVPWEYRQIVRMVLS